MATVFAPKIAVPKNYLNNRDILKQIHLSKNTYCSYLDPVNDHQYDIILPTLEKINQRTIAEARRNRADRIKRETSVVVDPKKIPNTDLVFRIVCWEHIPMAPKKISKNATKKKKIEDIFELELEAEDPLADLIDIPVLDPKHVRLPFPPFYHYRIDEDKTKIDSSSDGDRFICPAVMGRGSGSMQVPDRAGIKELQGYHGGVEY